MKLIDNGEVDFEQVLSSYYGSHGYSNKYEIDLLKKANEAFDFWTKLNIFVKDMEKIILPFHIEGESGNIVIAQEGERLNEAYNRLLCGGRQEYKTNTPVCLEKVMIQKKIIKSQGAQMFFFSKGAFREFSRTYKNIQCSEKDLVHLDGLHRLLAFMDLSSRERPKMINSYVAVRKNEK